MKNVLKISIIFMIVFILLCQYGFVFAEDIDPKDYNPRVNQIEMEDDFVETIGKILGVIRVIGIFISVIALMIIGIKEMTGSIEERTIIKNALPGYILGVLLVFLMTVLPDIIYKFMVRV